MKKTVGIIFAIVIACPFASTALAEDLLEVYNHAVRSDPLSIASKIQVLISKEQQQQAKANLLPQASLSGAFSENYRVGDHVGGDSNHLSYDGTSVRLSISQVLFDIQAYRDNEKWKLLTQTSAKKYQQVQSELMVRVVELYFNVLEAQDTFELTKKNKETIAKNLEQLKALYKKQLIPITGVYEAEARHDLALSEEIEAGAALSVGFERLYEVIGERVKTLASLKNDIRFQIPEDSIENWLDLAMQNNALIASKKANLLAAEKDVDVRKAGWYPKLSLGLSQSHQNVGYDNTPQVKTDTSSISLNFTQPLYEGGGISARKRESIYKKDVAKQEEIEVLRNVEQQLREHYLNLKSDVLKIKATKRRIESEKKRAESMKASFKYGTVTVNDVLNADTDYFKAQAEHQRAKYNYIKNQVRLKSVAGVIAEKDILELNNWVK